MKTLIFIGVMVAMLAVMGSLLYGLFALSKDGKIHREKSNKMMWMRVWLQGLAILLMFIFAGLV